MAALELRWYQTEAVQAIWDFLWSEDKAGYVVAPTASGKSLIQAASIQNILSEYDNTKILCVTHNQDLVDQNAAEFEGLCPDIGYGIYCAGLSRRELKDVTFGTVQSLARVKKLPIFEIIFIDEFHAVGKSTKNYMKLLNSIWAANPNAKIVGLSATPFRTDSGDIRTEGIFTNKIYEISIETLLEEGYLCPVKPCTTTNSHIDINKIKVVRGEYENNALAHAFMEEDKYKAYMALIASVYLSGERNKILIFGVNLAHCQAMQKTLKDIGIDALYADGSTSKKTRSAMVEQFRTMKRGVLINCGLYTTGFNVKDIDCVVMAFATKSAIKFVQVVGRLMRIADGKADGLLLDFGKNVERFGPINLLQVEPKVGGGKSKEPSSIMRACVHCGYYTHIKQKECGECGKPFPIQEREVNKNLTKKASNLSVISTKVVIPTTNYVTGWIFLFVTGQKKLPMVKIKYSVGLTVIEEYLCFDHEGYAKERAKQVWGKLQGKSPVPQSVKEAWARRGELVQPDCITSMKKGGFHQITHHTYLG